MVHHILAAHRLPDRRLVVEVALHQPDAARLEARGLRGGAHQRRHLVAGGKQAIDEVAPDEAGAPGHHHLHMARS